MNNVLIQHANVKFMRTAIFSSIDDTNIVGSTINNNLYQIFYSIKLTHAIFHAGMINQEIMQFIQDFAHMVKCFIYHDKISNDILKYFEPYNIIHLTYDNSASNSIKLPSDLINTNLFYNNKSILKQDSLVCLIDGLPVLPDFLRDHLYPKSKLPIKLFNNPNIKHNQNLGMLNERDKASILQQHKYYLILSDNDPYIIEAQNCGCIIVPINEIDQYLSLKYKEPSSSTDFVSFFKDNIL